MKSIAILCLLLGVTFCHKSPLREILKSSKETLKLYSGFKAAQHLQYSGDEDNMRFRLFRKSAEAVATYNEESDDAEFGLNFFSSLTPAEKKQYLGLNITGHLPNAPAPPASHSVSIPATVLWTNTGDVTEVKNQQTCGSCWTYGAVGALETRYKRATGVLRAFAEQEYLDCVYRDRDGCNGGWPSDCFDYSARNGGRLAAMSAYPYQNRHGRCMASRRADAMVGATITGTRNVNRGERSNLAALAEGTLAVAFEVTDYFGQYTRGIITDRTCRGSPNHAVTAVGYTARFVLVKNSWGSGWGDQGFVKFARNHGNCGLFDYSSYPALRSTGRRDSRSDAATRYRPDENDGPAPIPDPDGECPSGTVRCPDGVCRHEHMC